MSHDKHSTQCGKFVSADRREFCDPCISKFVLYDEVLTKMDQLPKLMKILSMDILLNAYSDREFSAPEVLDTTPGVKVCNRCQRVLQQMVTVTFARIVEVYTRRSTDVPEAMALNPGLGCCDSSILCVVILDAD